MLSGIDQGCSRYCKFCQSWLRLRLGHLQQCPLLSLDPHLSQCRPDYTSEFVLTSAAHWTLLGEFPFRWRPARGVSVWFAEAHRGRATRAIRPATASPPVLSSGKLLCTAEGTTVAGVIMTVRTLMHNTAQWVPFD